MNKRIVVPLAAFAVGAVCVILSRIIQADELAVRLLLGFGLAFAVLGFANAVSEFIASRVSTPETEKVKNIEEHDERNIQIRERAGCMTNRVMLYALAVCALVSAFSNLPIYVTLLFAGLILLQGILAVGFTIYYDKRL